ncbi:unnamed protein product, partial [marine sediment metagenome]
PLMIENHEAFIPVFAAFKDAAVYIHPEVSYHPLRSLDLIKSYGARAGIAIAPAIPLESIRPLLPHVELVCMMTVNPGYAGQKLLPQTIDKIKELAQIISTHGYGIEIEADGNVSRQNIPLMIQAGARILVTGSSSLYERGADLRENIERLYELIGRK